ncbi:MAG: heterodisulfide reductase-related iron-sulfur binding cluster [Rhodocyclaceae bacterium]
MTVREGSLEAPKRHAIDWRNADFYDEAKLNAELHRVFEICHGCRRCVNLCNAFPRLFDLIDEGPTGEMDGVPPAKYGEVVDQCYLCDMCFMTKCPYVPPHEWNLDFPHLMLRAKAAKFKKGQVRWRDKLLTSTDALGRLAAIPVVAQAVNALNSSGPARRMMQSVLGVHENRVLPPYSPAKFRTQAKANSAFPTSDGQRTPGKVAVFATCYVNYNEPGIGQDLLRLLEHNEIPSIVVEKEACCGMPKLELGDLDAVERLKNANIPVLAKLAAQGYAILTPIPSCTLMFKAELPLLFPEDSDVRAVSEAMFDPFEYFVMRHKDGLLNTQFKRPLGKVSYHIPCHSRVQNVGQKTREALQLIPDTSIVTVERCAGHDGTWGVKTEFFDLSMKIGRPVFRQMGESNPDFISSDCPIAGRHIQQGMGTSRAVRAHPLTLLRMAYGLE